MDANLPRLYTTLHKGGPTWPHLHTINSSISQLRGAESSPCHKRCVRSSEGFHLTSPTSCVPCPPASFATWPDIKPNITSPETCYLFIPCLLANLGPSREHKEGWWATPEVWGPATTYNGTEWTMRTFCSKASRKHFNTVQSANALISCTVHLLMCSHFGTRGCLQPTAMDRYHTEHGRAGQEHFGGSYHAHHGRNSEKSWIPSIFPGPYKSRSQRSNYPLCEEINENDTTSSPRVTQNTASCAEPYQYMPTRQRASRAWRNWKLTNSFHWCVFHEMQPYNLERIMLIKCMK